MRPVFASLLVTMLWGAAVYANLPEPLTNSDLRTATKQLSIISQPALSREQLEKELTEYVNKLIETRAEQYSKARVNQVTAWRVATKGTQLNLSEGRTTIDFKLRPPRPNMRVVGTPELAIEMLRGRRSRVNQATRPVVHSDQSVSFSFDLIEPNLFEKNVHVRYQGRALYQFTGSGAKAQAEQDYHRVRVAAEAIVNKFRATPPPPDAPSVMPPQASEDDQATHRTTEGPLSTFKWVELLIPAIALLGTAVIGAIATVKASRKTVSKRTRRAKPSSAT